LHDRTWRYIPAVLPQSSDRPLFARIADDLRERIAGGQYPRGLPSEKDLQAMYGVSGLTVRHAVAVLVTEGLVTKRAGARTQIRDTPPMARVHVDLEGREIGARIVVDAAEAEQYGVPVGAPLLTLYDLVEDPDGTVHAVEIEAWPAEWTRLRRE
jgi:DNA-binding transcriptional regulator YhcF (GntR family)